MFAQRMHECQTTGGMREGQEREQWAWMEEEDLKRETLAIPWLFPPDFTWVLMLKILWLQLP